MIAVSCTLSQTLTDDTYHCRSHDPIFRSPRLSAYSTIHPHSVGYKGEYSQRDDTAGQIWRIVGDYGHGFHDESRGRFVLYAKGEW